MTPETPPNRTEVLDYVFWWLSPLLLLVLGAICWVNHFDAGFHRDDFPNILENRNIRNGAIGELIISPRAFSRDTAHADFRPLLAVLYQFDYAVRHDASPAIFQLTSFLWFIPLPFFLYGLARALPEVNHRTAIFAASLFAVHPLVADTLNYISRRGELIAAGSVTLALLIWIVWPQRLPRTLGFNLHKIPKTAWESFIFRNGAQIERMYRTLLRAPTHFYFLPLVVGILSSPAATAFVCLAAAWVWVYEPQRPQWTRVYPAALLCAGWLLIHTVVTWTYVAPLRLPAMQYWLGQPRIAMQYFVWFFAPFNLSADAGLLPELRFWPPDILLGFLGVAALVVVAVYARRRPEWRTVSFGIAWFLLAQLPFALVPQATAESGARMFIPALGLAIATAHVLMTLALRAEALPKNSVPAAVLASLALFSLLGGLGYLTWTRNSIWLNDLTLSRHAAEHSPDNQRALIQYARELFRSEDYLLAREIVSRADKASPQDAQSEVLVAESLDRIGQDARAEVHYKRATTLWPRYAEAMSSYGNWLLAHQRLTEATDWSQRATRLNFYDNLARHNLMEIHSAAFEWNDVSRIAKVALTVDPDDARAKLALVTSQDALDRVGRAERTVAGDASFNDYLTLSVAYYRAKRYDDCVSAAQKALAQDASLAEAHANMATCYHALGRDDDAITSLREVVRLRPDMAFAWSNLQILEQEKRQKLTKVK